MLMLGKVLKGLKSVRGGKIRVAAGAVKAGSAALGAFVDQRGPDDRAGRATLAK
jgi:hypothetical protein